jgi:hypothetical protein
VLIARERRAIDDPTREHGDVDRYEQLRGQALAGGPGSSRLGLGLLQHRGVTAWTRAWQSTAPRPPGPPPVATPVGEHEIVSVLASMALACAAAA